MSIYLLELAMYVKISRRLKHDCFSLPLNLLYIQFITTISSINNIEIAAAATSTTENFSAANKNLVQYVIVKLSAAPTLIWR